MTALYLQKPLVKDLHRQDVQKVPTSKMALIGGDNITNMNFKQIWWGCGIGSLGLG
jgi:hypothetical protein